VVGNYLGVATTIVNFVVFMKVQEFFNENPVFRHDDFVTFLESNRRSTKGKIGDHDRQYGHRIKKGKYL